MFILIPWSRGYSMQVRKEYGKCFRHSYCCGGLPTESPHSSVKASTTRTSARYSSGTQVTKTLTASLINLLYRMPSETCSVQMH